MPTLLLLDVKPVGATQVDIENVHIQNLNANIESTGENSFEKILALQPDLIISSDIEKSSFEKFSKMAPTIIIPYETYSDVHEEVRAIGQMLGKDTYLYGDGIYKGGQAIYKQLQLTPPKRIKEELIDKGESYKQVSFEVLTDYAGDYIFFDISNGGSLDKNDPVWQSVDAVKKDDVFYLDEKRFRTYDPIAVLNQAEEGADMLVAKKQGQK
ncbi:ABC transporter substrate-binding protein [Paenibacillus antarcticus]|uniref:ABC transporter substrate-binding protein n=1 Tax=Paenibacillus antarcticus TaxID=253703 RepID=UPI001FE7B512|nr:ABC transporter substrate-binding protein [Paenibacillus antarcticus]